MKQTMIFTRDELSWLMRGGVVKIEVAGTKIECMTDETYEKRNSKNNDATNT